MGGSVYFVTNEVWGFVLLLENESEITLLAESLLQNKAPYVQIQELGKTGKLSGAAGVESGQRDEGSLSECNASGADPQNRFIQSKSISIAVCVSPWQNRRTVTIRNNKAPYFCSHVPTNGRTEGCYRLDLSNYNRSES